MQNKKFNKVVVWGHKLHSHTHSYIHNAFYRAFVQMGYDTYWFDDKDYETTDIAMTFDFNDCLFITEGQVCKNMPLVASSKYILHNCYNEAMWAKIKELNIEYLKLQVYTDDVLKYNLKQLEPFIYHDIEGKCIYMPWGTDLLPHEIPPFPVTPKTNKSWWVGTIGDGEFGNRHQINPFVNACRDNGIDFQHAHAGLSIEENIQKISESYMAPAIVGAWQKQKGYIPCRIFKNISYGQFGITNSKQVHELFEKKIIYSEYEYELFELMVKKWREPDYDAQLIDLIKFVREKHTYVNRINTILSVI